MYCPYCKPDTAGNHELLCPSTLVMSPREPTPRIKQGWQCPNCGKCHAPWVAACDCHVVMTPRPQWGDGSAIEVTGDG